MAGCVFAGGEEHKFMIENIILRSMMRIIDTTVLNPNGPNGANIFVQNVDAAHNSSERQVIDYIYEAQAPKKSIAAAAVRRR